MKTKARQIARIKFTSTEILNDINTQLRNLDSFDESSPINDRSVFIPKFLRELPRKFAHKRSIVDGAIEQLVFRPAESIPQLPFEASLVIDIVRRITEDRRLWYHGETTIGNYLSNKSEALHHSIVDIQSRIRDMGRAELLLRRSRFEDNAALARLAEARRALGQELEGLLKQRQALAPIARRRSATLGAKRLRKVKAVSAEETEPLPGLAGLDVVDIQLLAEMLREWLGTTKIYVVIAHLLMAGFAARGKRRDITEHQVRSVLRKDKGLQLYLATLEVVPVEQ